jgi:DNA polymerase V
MIREELKAKKELAFFKADASTKIEIPVAIDKIPAGFPSPADDYMEDRLDLNEKLIRNPSSTFFAKVSGHSMVNAGINDGDLIIIDKSLPAKNESILVCALNGEFTIKKLKKIGRDHYLMPENADFEPILLSEDNDFMIWGVVTYSIQKHY